MTTPVLFGWDDDFEDEEGQNEPVAAAAPAPPSASKASKPKSGKKPTLKDIADARAERLMHIYHAIDLLAGDVRSLAEEMKDDTSRLTIRKPRVVKAVKEAAGGGLPRASAEVPAAAAAAPPLPPAAVVASSRSSAFRPIMAPVQEYYANLQRKRVRPESS